MKTNRFIAEGLVGLALLSGGCGKLPVDTRPDWKKASLELYLSLPETKTEALLGDNAVALAERTAVGFPYTVLKKGFELDNSQNVRNVNNISSGEKYNARVGTNTLDRANYRL